MWLLKPKSRGYPYCWLDTTTGADAQALLSACVGWAPSTRDCVAEYIVQGAKMRGRKDIPWYAKIQDDCMYPAMTT